MVLDPRASSEVTDGATVSVPACWPDERADPGRVSRVGRESWDIKQLDDFPELDRPPGILRDRPVAANYAMHDTEGPQVLAAVYFGGWQFCVN